MAKIPQALSPDEATLEASPALRESLMRAATVATNSSAASDDSSSPCPHIALIEGSGPCLSGETHAILRARLRAAALALTFGFGLFWIRRLTVTRWDERADLIWLYFHFLVTLVLGVIAGSLCWRCTISGKLLRLKELLIFAIPAGFFLAMQYADVVGLSETKRYLESPAGPWLTLIYLYAMFIPSTWKRSALVLGTIAVAPVALFSYIVATDEAQGMISWYNVGGIALTLIVACVVAVFGVYTIGHLRREAFTARQFGQYHLKRLLGAGGMGEVYLAEHQLMKRPCAIKLIRPAKMGDPNALARFEREVRSTARLSHWNTIEIFDYGRTDDGTFYYVMEYLPGLNLSELVERFGPLPPQRVIHLLRQTCDALGEAHGLGLIHRDIKPGNIFAAQRGGVYDVAKLLDFGLVKPLSAPADSNLTQAGTITGSPLFMSPEQATGDREPDARSDIYALGAVAYFLLCGRPPFNDDAPMKVLISHATAAPTPPSQFKADVPSDLEDVVMRCLAKDPVDRYQTTADLSAALASCNTADRWTREDAARWWAARRLPASAQADTAADGNAMTAGDAVGVA